MLYIDMSFYQTKFIANQIIDLGNIMYNKTTSTLNFPSNTTTLNKQSIVYSNPTIIKTNDITASMDGFPMIGDQVFTFGPMQQPKYLIVSNNNNNGVRYSFSTDGYNFYASTNTQIFSSNTIEYDGRIWVMGMPVLSGSTMLYSYNGVNWNGLGVTTFSSSCFNIKWNGRIWLATGSGSNYLAYSYDGINWVAVTIPDIPINNVNELRWNGISWLLTMNLYVNGVNLGNIAASSYDGINWVNITDTAQLPSVFSQTSGNLYIQQPIWDSNKWLIASAAGNNQIWYTYDETGKTNWRLTTLTNISQGLGWNGRLYILNTGISGAGYVTQYSYSGISNWIRKIANTSLSTNYGSTFTIWDGQKFYITCTNGAGDVTSNCAAYSYGGTHWVGFGSVSKGVSLSGSVVGFNALRPHSITFQRNLTIASGSGTGNTLAYSLDGIKWTGLGKTVFNTAGYCSAYNGKIWVAGGSGGNTLAFSNDTYNWVGLGSYVFSNSCTGLVWNGSMYVAVGSGGNTLAYSYDGMTWITNGTSTSIFSSQTTSLCWNGRIWVIGGGVTGGYTIAYSTNGINWMGLSITDAKYVIATNGRMFIAGNVSNGCIISYDGINWSTTFTISIFTKLQKIVWNGSLWVATGVPNTSSMAYSYDGLNWNAGTNIFTSGGSDLTWNGSIWAAGGSGTNNIAYSYDGINWNSITGNTIFSSNINGLSTNYQVKPIPYIQHPTVALGSGLNAIAYSETGINWQGLGADIFTSTYSVYWNGSLWLAGGNGLNSLAYSFDGINWTGLGTSLFSNCNALSWNGTYWVAGTNDGIFYSKDGINWTKSNLNYPMYGLVWNGITWIAIGSYFYYSRDSIYWSRVSNANTALESGSSLATSGPVTVGVGGVSGGQNSMAYSTDITGASGWTSLGKPVFSTRGTGICWNGRIWVAVGQGTNTIAYSYTGISGWVGLGTSIFSTTGLSVCWNGVRFIATGQGTNTLAYSSNGINWYRGYNGYSTNLSTQVFTTSATSVASNPTVGAVPIQSQLVLDNYGSAQTQTLEVVSSDPYYQGGFNNVSVKVEPNYTSSNDEVIFYTNKLFNPSFMLFATSVRLVYPGYSGPVFTIRRSSDNATSDFYTDAKQSFLTTGANNTGQTYSSWIGSNTGYVSTWYDQSGMGNNAIQNTTANQPSLEIKDGKYVIGFNLNGYRWLSLQTEITPNTIYCQFYSYQIVSEFFTCGTIIGNAADIDLSQRFDGYYGTINIEFANDWLQSSSGRKTSYNDGAPSEYVDFSLWNSLSVSVDTPTTTTLKDIGSISLYRDRGLVGYMTEIMCNNTGMEPNNAVFFYANKLI